MFNVYLTSKNYFKAKQKGLTWRWFYWQSLFIVLLAKSLPVNTLFISIILGLFWLKKKSVKRDGLLKLILELC